MTRQIMIIGDVHGKWQQYSDILAMHKPEQSIQLGDFGWGFAGQEKDYMQHRVNKLHKAMELGDNKYFRGNHDNPRMCANDKFCMPDVTYDELTGVMTIAGANSIDKEWRTEGRDWWPDEELSYNELYKAIDIYEEVKPRVMITHECPENIVPIMFPWYKREYPSRTRQAFESMLYIHKPELWIHGHWHSSKTIDVDGTTFKCLNELEHFLLDIPDV